MNSSLPSHPGQQAQAHTIEQRKQNTKLREVKASGALLPSVRKGTDWQRLPEAVLANIQEGSCGGQDTHVAEAAGNSKSLCAQSVRGTEAIGTQAKARRPIMGCQRRGSRRKESGCLHVSAEVLLTVRAYLL